MHDLQYPAHPSSVPRTVLRGVGYPAAKMQVVLYFSWVPWLLAYRSAGSGCSRTVLCLQNQLEQLRSDHADSAEDTITARGGNNNRNSKWMAYNAAVSHLMQCSRQGSLPGRFYGRLCNAVAVPDCNDVVAVNAVLQEVTNLSSMLIVADRQTANAVVDHFRTERIGMVTCKILIELRPNHNINIPDESCIPLVNLLKVDPSMPEVQPLIQALIGSWSLVNNKEAAVQMLGARGWQTGIRNLVTRQVQAMKPWTCCSFVYRTCCCLSH